MHWLKYLFNWQYREGVKIDKKEKEKLAALLVSSGAITTSKSVIVSKFQQIKHESESIMKDFKGKEKAAT